VIGSTRQVRVFVHREPVDMRKHYDALSVLVASGLRRELLSGDVFLFVGKTRRRAKGLYWDGTGLCLFCKRLEKGRFAAPWERPGKGTIEWTMSELSLFFEGSEIVGRVRLSPEPYTDADRRARFG
jgi:transposase